MMAIEHPKGYGSFWLMMGGVLGLAVDVFARDFRLGVLAGDFGANAGSDLLDSACDRSIKKSTLAGAKVGCAANLRSVHILVFLPKHALVEGVAFMRDLREYLIVLVLAGVAGLIVIATAKPKSPNRTKNSTGYTE
jgi:hypothetical protein